MNEITKNSNNLISSIDDVRSMAEMMAKTGVFGGNAGEAMVKILAGRELGIGPFAAMTNVYMVKGRPSMSANMLAAKVKSSGKYNYRIVEHTDQICKLAWFENGQKIGESSFSLADAKRAGTQNLDRFPQNMLFARALSNGVRFHCPDIFFGISMYVPGEIEDGDDSDTAVDQEPYVIKGELVVDRSTGEVVNNEQPQPVAKQARGARPYGPKEFQQAFSDLSRKILANNHLDSVGVEQYEMVQFALETILPYKPDLDRTVFVLTGFTDFSSNWHLLERHYVKAFATVMGIGKPGDMPSSVSTTELESLAASLATDTDHVGQAESWDGEDE